MPLTRLISLVDKKQHILCELWNWLGCVARHPMLYKAKIIAFFSPISTWIVLPTVFTPERSSDCNEWYRLTHCLTNKYSPVPTLCLVGRGVLGTDPGNKIRKHRGPAAVL